MGFFLFPFFLLYSSFKKIARKKYMYYVYYLDFLHRRKLDFPDVMSNVSGCFVIRIESILPDTGGSRIAK